MKKVFEGVKAANEDSSSNNTPPQIMMNDSSALSALSFPVVRLIFTSQSLVVTATNTTSLSFAETLYEDIFGIARGKWVYFGCYAKCHEKVKLHFVTL